MPHGIIPIFEAVMDYYKKWCCLIVFANAESDASLLFHQLSTINCTKYVYLKNKTDGRAKKKIAIFEKCGDEPGSQMKNAFETAFAKGFRKVVLIKSNYDQVQSQQIMEAFNCLKMIEFCIGPKDNGDYYLIGMNYFEPSLFINKQWDSPTLVKETIKDIGKLKLALYKLPTLKTEEYAAEINA